MLRKARRLGDDDPDDAVWDALTRTTLDGLAVPPLGTPDLLDGLATADGPRAPAAGTSGPTPADREQALVDLDNGATSLLVDADADLAALLDGVMLDLAPGRARPARPRRRPGRSWPCSATTTPADGTNLGADATGDDVVEVAGLAREAGVLAAVVDATAVHEQGASDVQEVGWALAAVAAYLRRLEAAGFPVTEAAGLVGAPARRHRRPVRDDRQAPRGPPAVGPGAGAERGRAGRRCGSTRSPAGR